MRRSRIAFNDISCTRDAAASAPENSCSSECLFSLPPSSCSHHPVLSSRPRVDLLAATRASVVPRQLLAHTSPPSSPSCPLLFRHNPRSRGAEQIAKYPQVVDFVDCVRTRIASRPTCQGDEQHTHARRNRMYRKRGTKRVPSLPPSSAALPYVRETTSAESDRDEKLINSARPCFDNGLIGYSFFFTALFCILNSKYTLKELID